MDLVDQKLKKKADELRTWYNEQAHNLVRQEEKLSAAKDAAAIRDGKLAECEALLNTKEKDLATREGALAATLRSKDEEIKKLKKIVRIKKLAMNNNKIFVCTMKKTSVNYRMVLTLLPCFFPLLHFKIYNRYICISLFLVLSKAVHR